MKSGRPDGGNNASWRVLEQREIQAEKSRRDFANDVLLGLFRSPKSVPSRHFYDDEGNRLFQKIMGIPDYYLTNCELEILHESKGLFARYFGGEFFNLVELGAGDGTKTKVLLEHFREEKYDFRYVPIDICREAVVELVRHCSHVIPEVPTEGIVSEYFDGLRWLSGVDRGRNVVLFLGSNIGNFTASQSRAFLHSLRNALNDGDYFIVGFDLKKDIGLLMKAYSDDLGVTAEFNLNLLRRINRELGGNFRLEAFEHYATYNVFSGAMESYLVSREYQDVSVEAARQKFSFQPWEPIHTEVSQKYLPADIASLAEETGFEIVAEATDSRRYFTTSLWRVRKVPLSPARRNR